MEPRIGNIARRAQAYTEQYPDLWLAKEYIRKVTLDGECNVIKLAGTHNWPINKQLVINIFFDNEKIDKLTVNEIGAFIKEVDIPKRHQNAGDHILKLMMNTTFCPARVAKSQDQRELSFILNDIALEVKGN